jgi:uncharacterized protein involved in exopolysaccharide biosynthesis
MDTKRTEEQMKLSSPRKTIVVLGAITAGLLAVVVGAWLAIRKQQQDPNDWKSIDKRDPEAK